MAETTEYDKIFSALKHPLRRQILLLLEDKGEMPFTGIQNAVGLEDTGLLSYHLKELEPLVRQSARGKYSLSEVGEASMALFRKVEREKNLSNLAVQSYFEKLIGKVVFLFLIVGVALMVPLSADVYLSVQNIYASSVSMEQIVVTFLAGLFGMILGTILFAFYDRHYYSRNIRTNIVHSIVFAIGISLLSISSAYITYSFERGTMSIDTTTWSVNTTWLVSILRTVSFIASTPIITYLINRLMKRH